MGGGARVTLTNNSVVQLGMSRCWLGEGAWPESNGRANHRIGRAAGIMHGGGGATRHTDERDDIVLSSLSTTTKERTRNE